MRSSTFLLLGVGYVIFLLTSSIVVMYFLPSFIPFLQLWWAITVGVMLIFATISGFGMIISLALDMRAKGD